MESETPTRELKSKRRRNRAKEKVNLKLTIPIRSLDDELWFDEEEHKIEYDDLEIKMRSKLGEGVTSKVLKVFQKSTKKPFALKIIPYGYNVRPQIITREIDSLKAANCTQIVEIFEAYQIKGTVRILLEYMDCGSIMDILNVVGKIPENIIGLMSYQLLLGLSCLEKEGIIHRDIKPSNILINHHGCVKITDFGMAKKKSNSEIAFNSFKGTFCYMSPERLSGADHFYNSDCWSLGITLMEMFLGYFPFDLQKLDHFSYLEFLREGLLDYDYEFRGIGKEFQDFFQKTTIYEVSNRPNADKLINTEFVRKHNHGLDEILKKTEELQNSKDDFEKMEMMRDIQTMKECLLKKNNSKIKEWLKEKWLPLFKQLQRNKKKKKKKNFK